MPEASQTNSDLDRINRLEITMGKAVSSIETLAKTMSTVVEKTDQLTSHVSRLEAGQGKIPTGTIFGTISVLIAGFGLVLTLTISPINGKLSDLENNRKTTVEQHIPQLSSSLADLMARVKKNETGLGILLSDPTVGAFATSRWRGGIDVLVSENRKDLQAIEHRNLSNGWSKDDHDRHEVERNRYEDLLRKYVELQNEIKH